MKRQFGGTFLGLLFGLIIGVLVSFGVVWMLNKTPLPFVDKVDLSQQEKSSATTDQKPLALPGKAGDSPIDSETEYTFYKDLEKSSAGDARQPEGRPAPRLSSANPATVRATQKTAGENLFLQAGAFKSEGDAESLKAQLAILGFEARILKSEMGDRGTMHRVRVGPFGSAAERKRASAQLAQNGITVAVVR